MNVDRQFQVIPSGERFKEMLDWQHLPYVSSIKDNGSKNLMLIVADDSSTYGVGMMQPLPVIGIIRKSL